MNTHKQLILASYARSFHEDGPSCCFSNNLQPESIRMVHMLLLLVLRYLLLLYLWPWIQCVRYYTCVLYQRAAGIPPITMTTKWRVYYGEVYLWKGIVLIFTAEVYIDSSRPAKGSLTTLSWCCITLLDIYYQFVAKEASVLDDYK